MDDLSVAEHHFGNEDVIVIDTKQFSSRLFLAVKLFILIDASSYSFRALISGNKLIVSNTISTVHRTRKGTYFDSMIVNSFLF